MVNNETDCQSAPSSIVFRRKSDAKTINIHLILFQSNERYYNGKFGKTQNEMNPDLEPEMDHGFGVGKKPATDYAEDVSDL